MNGFRRIAISLPATGEEEWQALRGPVFSGWLTQGPRVAEFEQVFARRHEVGQALAVSSCTAGLHVILLGMGIGPGHEVIVPSFTWVATANVVRHVGAVPIFADVDPLTFTIDPRDAARKTTPRTRAVIAVHLFGLCADMDTLRQALPDHVHIIEDAACASGAAYKGRPAGGLGIAAAFSFHPRKIITTGEGGMVTTNDADLAQAVNRLRNHGAGVSEEERHHGPRPYHLPAFDRPGFNYRMTDLQGAVGLVQLQKLDDFIAERARWADVYRNRLSAMDWITVPTTPEYASHAWQAYVLRIDPNKAPLSRNALMRHLHDQGIATRPGTHAVHTLGCYRNDPRNQDCPVARECQEQTMAIPLHNRMHEEDYEYVIKAIEKI